jgi:hypothetical protein
MSFRGTGNGREMETLMHPASNTSAPFDPASSHRLDRLDAADYELTDAYDRLCSAYALMPDLPLGRAFVTGRIALDEVEAERGKVVEVAGL